MFPASEALLTSKGRALVLISRNGAMTKQELMIALRLRGRSVASILAALKKDGLIVLQQPSHGSRLAWYEVAPGVDMDATFAEQVA